MADTLVREVVVPQQRVASSTGPLLVVKDLSVRYGVGSAKPVMALSNVSLTLERGERVALVGESGSGKTTMGLAIAGFLTQVGVEVTASALEFDERTVDRTHVSRMPVRTPGMSMMFQDAMTSLDSVWTVGSQLLAVLKANDKLSRREARDKAKDWLQRVGLTDIERVMKARPYELSGGMRQRAMLALALAGNPRLLIADEPTSALDASLSREAMELLVELTDDFGASLLIISHDIHLCQEYADRTMVMYGGEIVEEGPSATLAQTATHPYTIGLLRCIPTLESANLDELPTLASVAAELVASGARS
ncbi:MAG: peptide transporter ATP-binding protein [Pseudonocardiales bacterium]|nr:peptide transporter ATP-binding protein [Pseudonocardiales bacterium]